MMLGFADSKAVMSGVVNSGDVDETKDGIVYNSGHCETLAVEEGEAHKMPTEEELDSEMYVPPSEHDGDQLDPESRCEDTPEQSQAGFDTTLTEIDRQIFEPGCTFSACHSGASAAAGLDLTADDLHGELLDHQVRAPTEMPLVDPGDADNSWLYRITSECDPQAGDTSVDPMPRNSPELLDPSLVATLRDWIDEGAEDN